MRDPANGLNLFAGGVWFRKADVVRHRPVEKKVVLHHDPKVRAEVAQAQRVQIFAVNFDGAGKRLVKVHRQTYQRALARAAGTDEGRSRTGRGFEGNVLEYRHSFVVFE